ncbi:thermonuclease family protein [Alcaligenaceae bacterium]|nr:thermonuclease family protein [Alcaligenaceae bacterium]
MYYALILPLDGDSYLKGTFMLNWTLSRFLFLLPIATALVFPVQAEPTTPELVCKVTSVHDGDSMRVRCPGDRNTTRVRMAQIDAPELDQAHGIKSRDYLRSICPVGTTARIQQPAKDQYDRLLGKVYCDDTDVNQAMVKSGYAWVYNQYVIDKSLYALQAQARDQRLGLWANRQALAPWKFRQRAK